MRKCTLRSLTQWLPGVFFWIIKTPPFYQVLHLVMSSKIGKKMLLKIWNDDNIHLPSLDPLVLHLLNFILLVFFLGTFVQIFYIWGSTHQQSPSTSPRRVWAPGLPAMWSFSCSMPSLKCQMIKYDFRERIITCNPFSSEAVKCQTFPGFLLKPESLHCLVSCLSLISKP